MIALIVAVSCGLEEVGRKPHTGSGEIWTGPGMNAGKDDPSRTIIYVTEMDYPDGYDWRADQEKGNVRCSLVVFADGLPMMKVPVGDAYETSPDPDMHRMIGGHLYTDYSTDSTTVIKKDGKEIFRYRGREMMFIHWLIPGKEQDSLSEKTAGSFCKDIKDIHSAIFMKQETACALHSASQARLQRIRWTGTIMS